MNLSQNLAFRRWGFPICAVALWAAVAAVTPGARAQDAPTAGQTAGDAATQRNTSAVPALPTVPVPPGLDFNRRTPSSGATPSGFVPRPRSATILAPSSALSLVLQAPSINETTFGGFPPDGDIATSTHFSVQVVNFGLTMYNLDTLSLVKQVNFATFFGDTTSFLFDPRIIFDPVWQRWVVLVDGCNPCNTNTALIGTSFYKLAISQTSDPTGSYFIYQGSLPEVTGDFADFPQLGMDLNSIIVTYNDFLANGGFDARTFAIAKAYLYNGLGYSVPVFGGSNCTIAPPYVLDNGGPSYTLVACPNDNGVFLGPISNSGLTNVSVQHWQAKVAVSAYTVPPCAPQPGVTYCLDTLDNRFENRSAQIGNRIWNVHTITAGTATPRWYEFNTSNNTLVNDNIWFATATSSDWHPSMIVNGVGATGTAPTGETFGTWMSVDASNNRNLQLRAIGGDGTIDSAGSGSGIAAGPASSQPLTNQTFNGNRSGDYSYISLYPSPVGGCQANEFAFLEGEVSLGTNWGTGVAVVKHC
jgi:hypothetical protein